MALNTGNPYLDAIGGTSLPLRNGQLYLNWSYRTDGSGGNWETNEVYAWLQTINTWGTIADISWEPSEDPPIDTDPRLRSWKETAAKIQEITGSDDPNTAAVADSPHDTTGILSAYYNVNHPAWTVAGLEAGGYMLMTMLHETGHLLGLEHPHDHLGDTGLFPGIDGKDPSGNDVDFDRDGTLFEADGSRDLGDFVGDKGNFDHSSIAYSIMSYNEIFGTDRDASADFGLGWAATPMAFDIAAIQTMYGAVAKGAGDNTYILGQNPWFFCIWDTGGTDTIRYDGSDIATIDLRYATLRDEAGGGGFVSRVLAESSQILGGITIAADVKDFDGNGILGVIIENAIGGQGRDTIIGNEVSNDLDGRGGTDSLRGMGGNDRLTGGGDRDNFLFDPNWGHDTITDFFLGAEFTGEDLVFIQGSGVASFGQFAKSLTPEGHLKLEFQGNSIVLNNIGLNDLKDYHLQFNRRVSDGYISGATVFVDANGNGELDGGESSTTTDATGAFTLAGSGQLVAFGGTDISTGLPFAGKLLAPSGSIVITPLTTLLVNGVNESDLLAAFDLPSGFDIRLGDPIAGLLAGHAGSAAVFAAGAKVIDTVIAMATALAGLGGDEADALNEAFAVIAEAINNLDPGQTLDLTDPAIVAKLFDNLAQLQGIDPGALTGAVATAIASSNATIDQHLETDGATDDLLTNVSDTQGQLQSNQSPAAIDDSAVVVKGKILQGNVLANDTDPDGDTVQLVGVSGGTIGASLAGKFGRIVFEADGDFTYVANKSGLPTRPVPQDTFEYIVTDGNAGAGTALLSVLIVGKNHKFQAGANTTLTGGESKDVLDGSLGNAVLIGEKSSDVLIGGAGNSHTGGKGKDIFLFRPDFGENTITDFDIKGDLIQIHASVFTTVADILAHTTDTLAGAVIDDGAGNRITLAGVFFDQLRENDFVIG